MDQQADLKNLSDLSIDEVEYFFKTYYRVENIGFNGAVLLKILNGVYTFEDFEITFNMKEKTYNTMMEELQTYKQTKIPLSKITDKKTFIDSDVVSRLARELNDLKLKTINYEKKNRQIEKKNIQNEKKIKALQISNNYSASKCESIEPPNSASLYAQQVLNSYSKGIIDIESLIDGQGDEFDIGNILKNLDSNSNEYDFNREMTPILRSIINSTYCCLSNCENYNWLNKYSYQLDFTYALKPDFLVMPKLFLELKLPNKSPAPPADFIFGIPMHPCLNSTVSKLFEGKYEGSNWLTPIKNEDLACAFRYGYYLSYFQPDEECIVVLYNPYEYYVIVMKNQILTDIKKCCWKVKGSLKYLQTILNEPCSQDYLIMGLYQLIEYFKLDGKIYDFLGRGATGYVFQVKKNNCYKALALKIVIINDKQKLEFSDREISTMVKYKSNHATTEMIIQYIDYREVIVGNNNTSVRGILFDEVGSKVDVNSEKVRKKLFIGLFKLHSKGFIHGDPRHYNALSVNGNIKWIDLHGGSLDPTSTNLSDDLRSLISSISIYEINDEIESLISEYEIYPTLGNIMAIYEKLESL